MSRIQVGKRTRSLSENHAAMLAESIAVIGLLTPITVTARQIIEDNIAVDGFSLVAGLHRLRAYEILGKDTIEASVVSLEELDRQLWEIDENLIRAELTKLDRGVHLMRRKDIYLAKFPSNPGGRPSSENLKQFAYSFSDETADKTGMHQTRIDQAIRWATRITPEVKDLIANTEIADSGVELNALSACKASDQSTVVHMVLAGKADSVREAKRLLRPPTEIDEEKETARQAQAIYREWEKANVIARQRFLIRINAVVSKPKLRAVK